MPRTTLHFINAREQLTEIEDWLSEWLRNAFAASAKLFPLLDTVVVVGAGKGVIPKNWHVGYAPRKASFTSPWIPNTLHCGPMPLNH